MPLPYILGRGCCNPLSTIFVDSPFLLIYLTVTTSPDYTKVSVNLYFTFSQTHKLGYKPALLTSDPGHLSNYPQCAINSTRCLQVSPSLGGTMLIAACHTDRVSNTFNGRLDLLTAHVDKQTRFLPSLSDIFPNSPVFVHKHKLPALTQNIGEKEEEAPPNLLAGFTARPEDDCYTLATRDISTRLALQKLITKPNVVRALQGQTNDANNAACISQPLMKYQIARFLNNFNSPVFSLLLDGQLCLVISDSGCTGILCSYGYYDFLFKNRPLDVYEGRPYRQADGNNLPLKGQFTASITIGPLTCEQLVVVTDTSLEYREILIGWQFLCEHEISLTPTGLFKFPSHFYKLDYKSPSKAKYVKCDKLSNDTLHNQGSSMCLSHSQAQMHGSPHLNEISSPDILQRNIPENISKEKNTNTNTNTNKSTNTNTNTIQYNKNNKI